MGLNILLSILFLILGLFYICSGKTNLIIEWVLLSFLSTQISLLFYVDIYSTLFLITVIVISIAVFSFSHRYMKNEKYFLRFHILVLFFILSIIILILSPNLFSLFIGWDGLGVTSYLLVIYFQNNKSYGAGIITALTNRLGDILILMRLSILRFIITWRFWVNKIPILIFSLLFIARITKRAQIPFSSWLPAAMAAPTPVSSLVHSSTLVTAGVYLVFRISNNVENKIVFCVGLLTLLMARNSAIFETDMKKIVALSTLSQLGLMFSSLGLGVVKISFFHLLTHAFFKAIIFLSVGNIIHLSRDYQDLRKVWLNKENIPITLSVRLVANIRLSGMPFLAGFYSKDIIIELLAISYYSVFLVVLYYWAVMITTLYSFRFLFMISFKTSDSKGLLITEEEDVSGLTGIAILFWMAVIGGSALNNLIFDCPIIIIFPLEIKNLVLLVILITILIIYFIWPVIKIKKWRRGNLWILPFISSIPNNLFLRNSRYYRNYDLTWNQWVISKGVKFSPNFNVEYVFPKSFYILTLITIISIFAIY